MLELVLGLQVTRGVLDVRARLAKLRVEFGAWAGTKAGLRDELGVGVLYAAEVLVPKSGPGGVRDLEPLLTELEALSWRDARGPEGVARCRHHG